MKKRLIMFIMATLLLLTLGCSGSSNSKAEATKEDKNQMTAANTAIPNGSFDALKDKKVLVAYYSWSGNTRKLAQEIQKKTGGHMVEIELVKDYPKDYKATVDLAKEEQTKNVRPELKTKVENLDQYDVIFLGFPNWWGAAPMPILTFLDSYNWEGKTIVPFFTHGGGGVQNCDESVRKNASKAKVLPYLCVSGGSVNSASSDVDAWLSKLTF